MAAKIRLDAAVEVARTGDIWLFRGRSGADRTIQTLTNSPVNHVGMAVVLDDLPPLIWHAELGRSLPDVWTGQRRRGAQLHDLGDAVRTWAHRYGQRAWLRQLEPEVGREAEDAVLRVIARMDGTPFPTAARVLGRWAASKVPTRRLGGFDNRLFRPEPAETSEPGQASVEQRLESAYCAEIVAMSYQAMDLLSDDHGPSWYDPGRFWSGDRLVLRNGFRLGDEVEVEVPAAQP
jgi:hypothetical protein